jgi:hypothetical protein
MRRDVTAGVHNLNPESLLYREHFERLNAAIACKKSDRTPVVILGDGYAAQIANVPTAQFYNDPVVAHKAIMDALHRLGDV